MSDPVAVRGSASSRRRRPSRGRSSLTRALRLASRGVSVGALLLIAGCAAETLFRSSFDATPDNQPPAPAQPVGTASVDGPAGSVVVLPPPVTPSGKWVKISRPTADSPVAGLQGNLIASRGDGRYTFSTTVFMPAGSGVATIQFERFGQPTSTPSGFLHLDLMPDNRVRIDDDEGTTFGSFPRNQAFIVQVTLDINATAPSAHIALGGAGASGTADRAILPPLRPLARQFGAVRLWMGFPHTGSFDATTIVVKRRTD